MVNELHSPLLILAQAAEATGKLPPPTRAAAMMALIAILLLGMFLVVAVLLGGHWVRRWGGHRRGPAVPPDLILRPPAEDNDSTVSPKLPQKSLGTGDTMISDDTIDS